ncbi:MAG TPA: hypothetical protein VGS22_05180 [Thermoanaerobaculia bacterium]|jgi:hypothetical protein|nr:hypothetical protein [Thermoanaerobaculia bacterium]
MKTRHLWATLVLSALALPVAAGAQEIRVNSTGDMKQRTPAAAFSTDGGFLIVWVNERDGLVARSFGPNSQARGLDRILVANVNLPSIPGEGDVKAQREPAVAALPNGNFLVAWSEETAHLKSDIFYEKRTVLDKQIFAQRFDRAGNAVGAKFSVNQAAADLQERPKIVVFNRQVAIAWSTNDGEPAVKANEGIFLRRFDLSGTALGAETRVGAPGTFGYNPGLVADSAGGFAVSWDGPDADGRGAFARFYNETGTPRGAAVQINTTTFGSQGRASLAQLADGTFLALWQGQFETPLKSRIYSQVVNRAGRILGVQRQVSDGALPWHLSPIALVRTAKSPSATWVEWTPSFPNGVFGVDLSGGAPAGTKAKISERQIGAAYELAAATNSRGDLLLVWEGFNGGDKPGITAKVSRAN